MDFTIIPYAPPGSNQRARELAEARARSHAARAAHNKRRLKRSDDWVFGGMEHTLRKIDDRAIALLKACPGHTPEVLISGHIVRTPAAASNIRKMCLPPFQEMMSRLFADPDMAFSVVEACASLVVPPQQQQPLKTLNGSSRAQGLTLVRKELDTNSRSFRVKWTIMCLALPTLMQGDLTTAEVHIRALVSLRQWLDLADGMDSLIWYVARSAAICFAVQSCQEPMYELEAISNDFWAVGYGQFPDGDRRRTTRHSFSRWKAAGVSDIAESCIEMYLSAVSQFTSPADYENAKTLNLMYNHRLATLHQLCSAFSDLDDSFLTTSIIIALQLHIVLDLGGILLTTVDTLCNRLYANLRYAIVDEVPWNSWTAEYQRCEVWLLLTGLMASMSIPEMHQWFSVEICFRFQILQIRTEEEVRSICDPFELGPEVLSPIFFQCAMEVAESCRQRRGLPFHPVRGGEFDD